MKNADTDIDIDFQDPNKALEGLNYKRAIIIDNFGHLKLHNSGIYFQDIPYNPVTQMANIDIDAASERGYFKFDFLHVHQYDGVKDEEHLDRLMNKEPIWEMLTDEFFIKQLSQIHNHLKLVKKTSPKSIIQLAMVLAMIRPAKSHLKDFTWVEIEKTIWIRPQSGDKGYEYKDSFFKKSHSLAYALGIVVQMNLLIENEII